MEMQFNNKSVHISEVKLGTVVYYSQENKGFGHIVGFSENCFSGELIIKVQWQTEVVSAVHPSNVDIY